MKYFIQKMAMFFLIYGQLCATTNQELFLSANLKYHETRYQDALKQYEGITHKTGVIFYNMGLCYYKSGQYAHALWAFKKAQQLATRKTVNRIQHNIHQTYKKLGKLQENSIGSWVSRMIVTSCAGTTLLQWQLLFLLLFYVISFLCLYWHISWKYRLGTVTVCFLLCAMIPVIATMWNNQSRWEAIVVSEQLPVYSGPYQACHVQGQLQYADEITVLKSQKNWYKVKYNTIIGWVPAEAILPIM